MFEIEIDARQLDELHRKFKRASAHFGQTKRSILANIGEEVIELVREGFEKESDPYGQKWAALKYRSGRILQDTGKMRNSFHRKHLTADSVTVGPGVSYARFHQSGTRHMPARKMVPDGGNLPGAWRERINDIAQRALLQALKG